MTEPKTIISPSKKILLDEDLCWLGLDNIPESVYNPLTDYRIGEAPDDPVTELVSLMRDVNYLHFAVRYILNVELLPFQLAILDTLWNKKLPMLIGCRGLGKSFLLSVYVCLRLIFHPGCRIVVVGAAFRQSKQLFEYVCTIWDKAPVLKDIAGGGKKSGPMKSVDRCEIRIGDSVCYFIPIGNGDKIRGLRANYIIADEFASIPESIFNIVIQGFGIVASSPVDKVKQAALVKQLKSMGMWSDELDILRRQQMGGNQIVYSGTAYYSFNHFYKYFKKWHSIICSRGDAKILKDLFDDNERAEEGFNWRDYAVVRVPYTEVPDGLLDPGILAQAKATLSSSQFACEYMASFPTDSDGFYKRSVIEAATTNKPILLSSGQRIQFSAQRTGDVQKVYVIGVDPAADRDNAAIVTIELNTDHRKVVNCWTTNKKKYNTLKKYMRRHNINLEDDYYRYIAKKIREIMRTFNTEIIIMDKNGGGTAIAEALGSQYTCGEGETPVYPLINPQVSQPTDGEEGLHVLQLLSPNLELNSDANHGMLKDLQDKTLLFPMFDAVELVKASELDKINNVVFDTYEDLVQEIEELKDEITTVVCTPSSNIGHERFDTPEIKASGSKKGHLRKDRYSALLYANYYARNKNKNEPFVLKYKAVGGSVKTSVATSNSMKQKTMLYHGIGTAGLQNAGWMKHSGPQFRKG